VVTALIKKNEKKTNETYTFEFDQTYNMIQQMHLPLNKKNKKQTTLQNSKYNVTTPSKSLYNRCVFTKLVFFKKKYKP
jgi:hypothetical protein